MNAPSNAHVRPNETVAPVLDNAPDEVLAAFHRLNTRQQAFALALPTAKNHAQAAITAGYSPHNVSAQANKLYRNPHIRLISRYLSENALERAGISTERCFRELAKLAFANPASVFNADGQLLPPDQWPDEVAASLTEIKLGDTPKLKFSDKHAVLRTLLELAAAFPDKREKISVDHKIGVVTVPLKLESTMTVSAVNPLTPAVPAQPAHSNAFVLPNLSHD